MVNTKIQAWRRLVAITGKGIINTKLNFRNATEQDILTRIRTVQAEQVPAPVIIKEPVQVQVNEAINVEDAALRASERESRQRALDRIRREEKIGFVIPISEKQARLEESEQKAIQASDERIQAELDEIEEKIEIKVQEFNRVNDFKEFRITSNASNIRGLYVSVDKLVQKQGDVPFVVLFLIDRLTGRPRRITINTQFLDSFEDFNDRLAQITFGNVEGSAPISDEQYDLMVDRFDAVFIDPLSAGEGSNDKLLCEIIELKPSGKKTCIKDTMKYFGYKISGKIKTISQLLKYIKDESLPVEIITNKISLVKGKRFIDIYDRKNSKFYDIVVGKKKKKIKLSVLKPEDYTIYDEQTIEHNKNGFVMEPTKEGVMIRREIFKTKDIKLAIYSRDEKHIAPVKVDTENNTVKRSDLYICSRKEIYEMIDGEPRIVLSRKQTVEYMRKGTCSKPPIKKSNCAHRYLYIDYETVIDWSIKEVMIPISLSIIDLNATDLVELVDLEKKLKIQDRESKKNITKFKERVLVMRKKAVTYIGYDCTKKMMKYIDSQYKRCPQYTIVTFNGSYFDNLILLSDLLSNADYTDKVSDIFYTNNMLRNFKIYGRHEMFDLARHAAGSLKYNCKNYKINVFPKKTIDFKIIQEKYESGELDKMMNNYNKGDSCEFIDTLIEYNDYDVLSLATLYKLYENAMDKIIEDAIYTDRKVNPDGILLNKLKAGDLDEKRMNLRNYKTIGSMAYKMLQKYWSTKLDLDIPSFVFHKKHIPKNAKKEEIKRINKKNWEIHEKNNRYYKYYQDMQKFKTAGRVELFNGIKKYFGRARSLDITSSYPYSMAVNSVYYPSGEMIEVKYIDDMPEGKIGWFYCDIDQKILREKGLPNIVAEKTKMENIWQTKKVLKDYFMSTIKIDQMVKYGMVIGKDIIIYNGLYFTDKIRGCDLFEPLLSAMMTKVCQDMLKQTGSIDYNAALRQTVKLFLNCISGKIIERIHVNKIDEIKNAFHYHQMKESKRISKLNTISILGDRIFCSYTKREQDMMNTHRPIYWGILVYDYSQINLYDNTLAVGYNLALEYGLSEEEARQQQIAYRKEIFLCDTDACKMSSKAAEMCLGRMSKLQVPHWDKVEEYDSRYVDHMMYNPNSKVFGGYEDEFECYNNVNFFLAKKHYAGFFDPSLPHDQPKNDSHYNELVKLQTISTLDFHFKGVNPRSLVLNNHPYKQDETVFHRIVKKVKGTQKVNYSITEQRKAYMYYNNETISNNTMISGKNCYEYFNRLSQGKVLHILCQSFRKQMGNMKRDVSIEDKHKFNKSFNKISMCYSVKAIKCVEKHINQKEERLIQGKDYDIINCDGEILDKNGNMEYQKNNDTNDDLDYDDLEEMGLI